MVKISIPANVLARMQATSKTAATEKETGDSFAEHTANRTRDLLLAKMKAKNERVQKAVARGSLHEILMQQKRQKELEAARQNDSVGSIYIPIKDPTARGHWYFYHGESDSYVETFLEEEADRLLAQGLDEVSATDYAIGTKRIEMARKAAESPVQITVPANHPANEKYYDPATGIPTRAKAGLSDSSIVLDESQVRAIDNLLNAQCGCLIGAAGSGKTTVTKFLVDRLIYDLESEFTLKPLGGGQMNIAFVSFTGMSVQVIKRNLPEWLQRSCMTIHGLLEFIPAEVVKFDPKTGAMKVTNPFLPSRTEERLLEQDMIIIDEASMCPIELWDQLRKACKPETRIIAIGDLNQLKPSVGDSFFAYALGQWQVSELTHIHRQKGPGASKIIDVAHSILNGQQFEFDQMKGNPHWRVAGAVVSAKPDEAQRQILATINALRKLKHEDGTVVYDPYRDRIMTAGNGYDEFKTSSFVQQGPLNESLALMIQPPSADTPRYIIDAGRGGRKRFAVGNRIMALKNESPSVKDRITNGMAGKILEITPNEEYTGNPHLYGPEEEVRAYQRESFRIMQEEKLDGEMTRALAGEAASDALDMLELPTADGMAAKLAAQMSGESEDEPDAEGRASAYASHSVKIEFDNGAIRTYWSKAQIESIQLAYASTVAKCQGSQFPLAIIIVHHAVKFQLSREWLYTAVTRAQGHVIIFYTDLAMRVCLNKQLITGKTLKEKIDKYRAMFDGESSSSGISTKRNVILDIGFIPSRDAPSPSTAR